MDYRGSCCDLCQSVLPMFSSRSFIVSGLTFRSLIHFKFIFVYGVRKSSSFILLQVVWPAFPALLVKEIVFNPLYILASFVKDKMSIGAWIYLWAFYFVPFIYISVFVSTILSWWLRLCSRAWSQVGWSSSSILLSQDCFGYLRVFFVFPYKLWNYLF